MSTVDAAALQDLRQWLRIAVRTLTAALVFAAILGFARFSFGLLLPAIKADVPGTYGAYGFTAAANFAGYLAGTASVPFLLKAWHREHIWNNAALLLMAVGLFATALATSLPEVAAVRFAVGACSGVAAILTISLTMSGVPSRARGLVSGGIWAGGSVGVGICGALINPHAHLSWRLQYAVLAALTFLATLAFAAWRMDGARAAPKASRINLVGSSALFRRIIAAYALFGFGYIVYMVYATPYWLKSGLQGGNVAEAWIVFGAGGVLGAIAWGRFFDRFRSPLVLSVALITCACGVLLNVPFAAGMAIFGIPAIVSVLAREISNDAAYTQVLSALTVSFGIGQSAGPLAAGSIIDRIGLPAGIPIAATPILLAAGLASGRRLTNYHADSAEGI